MSSPPALRKGSIGILVVDDDAILLEDVAAAFTGAGMAVFEARDADEAMAILVERDDISVVVTDLDMPSGQMSRRDFVEAIGERWPDLGILILSGANVLRPKILPEGVRLFHKPSLPVDLVSAAFAIVSRQTGSL